MSSMEDEYIVAVEAAMEAIWICKFIFGLGVVPGIDKPMDIYCDNTGAITIADEPSVQKGAKHFSIKYHFIHEVIQEGDIQILKVHTDNNLADPFTKPMPCTKHVEHARSIRLRPAGFGLLRLGQEQMEKDAILFPHYNVKSCFPRSKVNHHLPITEQSTYVFLKATSSTEKLVNEIGELRAIFSHVLGASGVQIPQNNLDNQRSTEEEEDGATGVLDPRDVPGSVLLEITNFAILGFLLEPLVLNVP
ncbi:hypothetical protein Tco_1000388 [Tanacetum coccineum]